MAPDLEGWVPIRIYWQDEQPLVDWCYLGDRAFTEPFFEQTIEACLRHPFNLLFRHQTPIEALLDQAGRGSALPPSGFIFHMSRCGSTLIAQMLAAVPGTVVISEAGPIDTVLRAQFRSTAITEDQRVAWLRSLLTVFGRRPGARHLVVKFDSWSMLDLPLIQRAFPHVPWIFVFRDPVEVMVSQRRMRGAHMIPGVLEPRLFGLEPDQLAELSIDAYGAHVLATICEAALRYYQPGAARLVDYRSLPSAVWSSIAGSFGIVLRPPDIEQPRAAARFHAKNPRLPFTDDSMDKQAAADAELRGLVARRVGPLYDRMVEIAAGQVPPSFG